MTQAFYKQIEDDIYDPDILIWPPILRQKIVYIEQRHELRLLWSNRILSAVNIKREKISTTQSNHHDQNKIIFKIVAEAFDPQASWLKAIIGTGSRTRKTTFSRIQQDDKTSATSNRQNRPFHFMVGKRLAASGGQLFEGPSQQKTVDSAVDSFNAFWSSKIRQTNSAKDKSMMVFRQSASTKDRKRRDRLDQVVTGGSGQLPSQLMLN